jgi:hypothetical protein
VIASTISVGLDPAKMEQAQGQGFDFPALRAAVVEAGFVLRSKWADLASGPMLNRLTGDYVNHLNAPDAVRQSFEDDPFAVAVFNTARHAAAIEDGFAAFNLAERINWPSPKTRYNAEGGMYLIIPFRHYTPNGGGEGATVGRMKASMPASVHQVAVELQPKERLTFKPPKTPMQTVITAGGNTRGIGPAGGKFLTPGNKRATRDATASATRVPVGVGKEVWQHPGPVKSPQSIAAGRAHAQATGQKEPSRYRVEDSIYEGMRKTGAANHTQYMTWRVITPDSQWWVPGQEGKHIAKAAAEEAEPAIRTLFAEAFAQDVEAALARALAVPGRPIGGANADP